MNDLARTLAAYTYQGVEFPGSESGVSWGHDSAKHQGYLQRGQVSETTGQRARVFKVKVPLRNGLRWTGPKRLYPETYLELREKLKTAIGSLTHPTYGFVTVHVDDVQETLDPARPDGLDLDVTFTEQDGDAQELELSLGGPAAASPSEAALAQAEAADAAAASFAADNEAWTWTSLDGVVTEAFDYLEAATRSYTDASARFAALADDIRARLADPAIATTDGHDLRVALTRCLAATASYRVAYLGTEAPEVVSLPEEMGLARAALYAYGDPTRGAELASKNRIPDPTAIPAGTELVI